MIRNILTIVPGCPDGATEHADNRQPRKAIAPPMDHARWQGEAQP
jgi:hypothetical protein